MEVAPVHATVPTTWQKDYTSIPSSSRIDENLDRVSQTIYTVTTYDKAGKLDYYTSLRYLEYLVWESEKEGQQKISELVYQKSTSAAQKELDEQNLLVQLKKLQNFTKKGKQFPGP